MMMQVVKLHKDYNPEEFICDRIERAYAAIGGTHSVGRFFFIAHLSNPLPNGSWMAFLRRPDKMSLSYEDVPFNYEGFKEDADADGAIHKRAYDELGWRIKESVIDMLPTKVDKNLEESLLRTNAD